MKQETLFEGVLNDDYLEILEGGYYYKNHNKATVKLVYYTYASEWSNTEHKRFFKTEKRAREFYEKHFKDRLEAQNELLLAGERLAN